MRFSIIIPAHNAEDRIRRMLDSIKMQTFTDYELIIVCDACEDNTAKVAREYTDKVFEVNAHNAAISRNKGLDEAKGEWVLFCDDDDYWIHQYALEQIDTELKSKKVPSDMTQCAFVFGVKGVMPVNGRIWPNVWSKVFKRSAIGNTRFNPKSFPADDLDFVNAMLQKGVTVSHSTMLWYYYVYPREGSIMWKIENAGVR